MKVSWKQCLEFDAAAQSFLQRTKEAETKLSYAIRRVTTRMTRLGEQVNEALTDIDIDLCEAVNDVITRDAQGNLQYTKENLKKRNRQRRGHSEKKNLELEPYFATSIPEGLTEFEIEAFAGIVISTEDAKRLLSEIENEAEQFIATGQNGDQPAVAQ